MEKHPRKYVMDIFTKKLRQKFDVFCREHQQINNLDNFITYLIDQDLIAPGTIKHYAINEMFNELYADHEKPKTEIINTLADRFNLTPRSIWNALRKNTHGTNSGNRLKIISRLPKL